MFVWCASIVGAHPACFNWALRPLPPLQVCVRVLLGLCLWGALLLIKVPFGYALKWAAHRYSESYNTAHLHAKVRAYGHTLTPHLSLIWMHIETSQGLGYRKSESVPLRLFMAVLTAMAIPIPPTLAPMRTPPGPAGKVHVHYNRRRAGIKYGPAAAGRSKYWGCQAH